MNKKEFYVAPEWGLRTVRVERQFLSNPSDTSNGWNDPATDGTTWGESSEGNGME